MKFIIPGYLVMALSSASIYDSVNVDYQWVLNETKGYQVMLLQIAVTFHSI